MRHTEFAGEHLNKLKDAVSALSGGMINGLNILGKTDVAPSVFRAVEAAHKLALSLA